MAMIRLNQVWLFFQARETGTARSFENFKGGDTFGSSEEMIANHYRGVQSKNIVEWG